MRRAVITIRWEGPDKAVRDLIEDALDKLFFEMTMSGKILAADSSVEFTARVKDPAR
jgi:hypothetical protein